jgi:hypothetical protein
VPLPQRGTVSASALDLAFCLTRGEIFVTGVDLALDGIRSHARPYGFDWLCEEKERRLNPFYSQTFKRAAGLIAGGSHEIYASWFGRQIELWPRRLFSLGKNNPVFRNLLEGTPALLGKPPPGTDFFRFSAGALKKPKNAAGKGAAILRAALGESPYKSALREELVPLLFPGQNPSAEDIKEAVASFARPQGGCRE